MTTFALDSFTGTAGTALASHTGQTGATWTQMTAYGGAGFVNMGLSGAGRLLASSAGNFGNYFASGTNTSGNRTSVAEVDVYFADYDTTTAYYAAGLVMNVTSDGQNGYMIRLTNTSSGVVAWELYKLVSGAYTSLTGGGTVPTITAGMTLRIRGTVTSTNVICSYSTNGGVTYTQAYSTADTAFTNSGGTTGVHLQNENSVPMTDTTGWHLDDFIAYETVNALPVVAVKITPPVAVSSNVGTASGNFVATLLPIGGSLTGDATVTLTDSLSATLTPSTLTLNTGTPNGTFTVNPSTGGAGTISQTNNKSLTALSGYTYTGIAVATAYTMTESASTGVINAPVTLTFQANGAPSSNIVVTPASTVSGTFSPTTVTLTSNAAQTCTFTPSAIGTATISATHTGGGSVTNPGNLTYVVTAAAVLNVNDERFIYSPYNWDLTSVHAYATDYGSNVRFSFNGTGCSITVDAASMGCGVYMKFRVDGQWTEYELTSGTTSVTICTGLPFGNHDVEIHLDAPTSFSTDAWNGAVRLNITGYTLTGGAGLIKCFRPDSGKYMLVIGDSITAAHKALSTDTTISGHNNIGRLGCNSYSKICATALRYEHGMNGHPGGSWTAADASGWPGPVDSLFFYRNGVSKLVNGLFSPQPTVIWINLGENDASYVSGETGVSLAPTLAAWRVAAPYAAIILQVPFSGRFKQVTRDIVTVRRAAGDTKIFLVDYGAESAAIVPSSATAYPGGDTTYGGSPDTQFTLDGQHPAMQGHAHLAALMTAQLINILGFNGGGAVYPGPKLPSSSFFASPSNSAIAFGN